MTIKQPNSARHSWALCTLIVSSMAACSGKERSDLVLVDVDMTEVPSAKTLNMAILANTDMPPKTLKAQTVDTPELANGIAKIALAQTAEMAGVSIFVKVTALENGGVVGQGFSQPLTVESGKNAGPVAVRVLRSGLGPDAGAPDADAPDAFAYDGGPRADTVGTPDAGTAADGKSDANADVLTLADAVPAVDVPLSSDALGAADLPPITDVPVDAAADTEAARPDAPLPDSSLPEAGTILSTLPTCKRYVHYPNSPQTCAVDSNQESVLVNTAALTPDGKYLVSAANNSWVKIWKVVDNGLVDTNIVIVGDDYWMTATISPKGDLLAVANPHGDIVLYDMAQTITYNAGVEAYTLAGSKLAHTPNVDYNQAFFTSDQKQLVVIYSAANSRMKDGGIVAVWDLATRSVVREFTFDSDTVAYTVSNSSSTGPLWTVMGKTESTSDDAGHATKTTVWMVDALGVNTSKPTFVVADSLLRANFSPDNGSLALGTTEGDVEIWDLSSLTNIQRIGSPLVQGGSYAGVYGLGFTPDGQFMTAGTWKDVGISTLYVFNLKTSAVLKRTIEYEPRAFSFGADGTTWAYGLGGCGYLYFCK